MLPQDSPTTAQIRAQRTQEALVKLSADAVAVLKIYGYYIKKVDGGGWSAHLVKCPYPVGAMTLTQNGAWQLCQRDYDYRTRQRRIAATEPVVTLIEHE